MKEISLNLAALIKTAFVIGVLVAFGYFMSISDRKTQVIKNEEMAQKLEQRATERQKQLNAKKEDSEEIAEEDTEPSSSWNGGSFNFTKGKEENSLEKMKEKGGVTRSFDDFKK